MGKTTQQTNQRTAPISSVASASPVGAAPPPLAHALSGALGAVIAMALLYPLDQVRAILQVDDELARECAAPGGAGILGAVTRILQRHGKGGLWRGMVPVLITMGVSNFVYFYCFNGMKAALLARRRLVATRATASATKATVRRALDAAAASGTGEVAGLSPLESVVASTVAGVINILATTPLWVSNLRIKAGHGNGGLLSTLAMIGRREGLEGLWSGTAPSLVLVSNPIIQFVVYETLKQAARKRRNYAANHRMRGSAAKASASGAAGAAAEAGLPSHEAFLLGAAAKAASTLVTYPLQLAQAKLRAGSAQRQIKVCRQNGVSGMYQGMRAKLLHTVLTSALLFLGYERLLQAISNLMTNRAVVDATNAPPANLTLSREGTSMAKKMA